MTRNSQEAFSASTTSLRSRREQVAIGLEQRRPSPAQQARLHLAHEAGEQRRQQQHQQHLRALHGEIEDHGHIASTSSSETSAAKTRLRYWRMVRNCSVIEPLGGEADAAGDRRVERVPDQVAQVDRRAARAAVSPGGGISTCSRARNTTRAEHAADRLGEAVGGVLRRRARHRDSRNPRRARGAARRRRSGGSRRPRATPRAAMNTKTSSPL